MKKLNPSDKKLESQSNYEIDDIQNLLSEIWTINFDLDTNSPYYDDRFYDIIHTFLEAHGFEYRQHSGDITSKKEASCMIVGKSYPSAS